jgi:two-component system LytT family sensor kinase
MNAHRPLQQLVRLGGISLALIGPWILVALFSASEFYQRAQSHAGEKLPWVEIVEYQLVAALVWAFFTPMVVAMAQAFPISPPYQARNAAILLLFAPLFAAFRAVAGGLLLMLVEAGYVRPDMLPLSLGIRFHRYTFMTLLIIAITNLVLAQRDAMEREQRSSALEALLTNEQLEQLRAQLQPHFLFTTLEAIKSRVHGDPAAADRMLIRLSELLRRSLDFDRRDRITLAEELDFVDRFLDIHRATYGERLVAYVEVADEAMAALVPPLLLQPLVENAVVHGIAPRGSGRVVIRGGTDGQMLALSILDDGRGCEPGAAFAQPGGGLAVMRARLESLFGRRQSLTLGREGEMFVAQMKIPFRIDEEDAA